MTTECIDKTVEVDAAPGEVWGAWTTSEGARSFFAPDANIELAVHGRYEILFDLDEVPGRRGSEGMRVLAYLPGEMLAFEWNAPPSLPEARDGARSFVVVEIDAIAGERSRVRLRHLGFEHVPQGEAVRAYFVPAWDAVMGWLEHRFRVGPIDWSAPPRPRKSFATTSL